MTPEQIIRVIEQGKGTIIADGEKLVIRPRSIITEALDRAIRAHKPRLLIIARERKDILEARLQAGIDLLAEAEQAIDGPDKTPRDPEHAKMQAFFEDLIAVYERHCRARDGQAHAVST